MKSDKEADLITKAVDERFYKLVLSGSEENGLMDGSELAKLFENHGCSNFSLVKDLEMAIDYLRKTSKAQNLPGLIFGSHYISETVFNKFGILTWNFVISQSYYIYPNSSEAELSLFWNIIYYLLGLANECKWITKIKN